MARRVKNLTDLSTTSSMIQDINAQFELLTVLDTAELDELSPQDQLKRYLSLRSILSASSSFAERQEAAQQDLATAFRHIGQGTCGTVYEQPGTTLVLKVAATDEKADQLWNDYEMHTKVVEAFESMDVNTVLIPSCLQYITYRGRERDAIDAWWQENEPKFPAKVDLNDVLITERIFPLPSRVRNSFIDLYCPEHLVTKVRDSPRDKDCLARVYLGKRNTRQGRMFTLRNFGLTVDRMEALQLEVEDYAKNIALALAVMHWKAGVDADDVEFVLGSSPTRKDATGAKRLTFAQIRAIRHRSDVYEATLPHRNFRRRAIQLWCLDFNRCKPVTRDEAGVKAAMLAFNRNDPYFPVPLTGNEEDERNWVVFSQAYLRTSFDILQDDTSDDTILALPQMFLDAVTDDCREKNVTKAAAAARSDRPPPADL